MLSIITPSRTDEYCERLLQSIRRYSSGQEEIVVATNGLSREFISKWSAQSNHVNFTPVIFTDISLPFNFSTAINRAIQVTAPDFDLFLVNDDCEILTPGFSKKIADLLSAPETQEYGVISVRVDGGVGNEEQRTIPPGMLIRSTARTVCFVAVLIRREAWNQVGLMDEAFVGSFGDDDWCFRARAAGWQCGITGLVTVRHGFLGKSMANSFSRYMKPDEHQAHSRRARDYFLKKWGRLPDPAHYRI